MIPPHGGNFKIPIGDWVTTVAPSLNQEALRFVFHNLHTLPGWKVAQIISARSCPASGWKVLGQNLLQLRTYRQASVYSRNSMNIARSSRMSQHRSGQSRAIRVNQGDGTKSSGF